MSQFWEKSQCEIQTRNSELVKQVYVSILRKKSMRDTNSQFWISQASLCLNSEKKVAKKAREQKVTITFYICYLVAEKGFHTRVSVTLCGLRTMTVFILI